MAVNDFYVNNIGYGPETLGRNAPGYTDVRILEANTAEVQAVPAGARFVVFSSTANFFAKIDDAAVVPSGDVTDGSGSELNPSVWFVGGNSTIGLISSSASTMTLSFHR